MISFRRLPVRRAAAAHGAADAASRPAREVLLKVLAAGVCHSDLHIWDGYYDMGGGKRIQLLDRGIKLPLTMGHENRRRGGGGRPGCARRQGRRQAAGLSVDRLRRLQRLQGAATSSCASRRAFSACSRNGGYSDHVLVPHPRYLLDIGDLPPEQAAPLACSGVTTYGALKKLGATLQREPVVIIGAGGLGLMCLALAQGDGRAGAIVVDIDPVKRDAAMKAGATAVVDGNAPDAAKQIMTLTKGGAWSVIDLVGSSSDRAARRRQSDQGRQAGRRRPVRRRHHDLAAARFRCAR